MTRVAALLALLVVAAAPLPADYDLGKQQFAARRWPAVLPPLQRFYETPGGELSDVAYMIGTSFCQLGRRSTGVSWLDYTLDFPLDPDEAAVVRTMRENCAPLPPTRPITVPTAKWSINRAELLYWGDSATTVARPVSRTAKTAAIDLAARRVPLGHPAAARYGGCAFAAKIWLSVPAGPNCGGHGAVQVEIVGRYRFILNQPHRTEFLTALAAHLDAFAGSLASDLSLPPPGDYVTVVLARDGAEIARIAAALHGLAFDPQQSRGYSVAGDLSLVAAWDGLEYYDDSPTRRTLRHELFHLIARSTFGDIPAWLDEGLAQYFSVIDGDDRRAAHITDKALSWGPLPSLRTVLEGPPLTVDAAGAPGGASVAVPISQVMMRADVARMFLAWVDAQGRLPALVAAFRRRGPGRFGQPGEGSVSRVERALGQPLAAVATAATAASIVCQYRTEGGRRQWVEPVDPACIPAWERAPALAPSSPPP